MHFQAKYIAGWCKGSTLVFDSKDIGSNPIPATKHYFILGGEIMKGKKFIVIISIVCIFAVMLCIPAFATVTESDGDGYSLYGGVKLPDVSDVWTDKLSNPFAWIYVNDDIYYFTFGNSDVYISDNDNRAYSRSGGQFETYSYNSYTNVWNYVRSYTGRATWEVRFIDDYKPLYVSDIIWSNFDISNKDNSTIRFDAVDSIPLDGYNIIEWDGDISGLTEVVDGYFNLAPYQYASHAYAVFNSGVLTVQSGYFDDSPVWGLTSLNISGLTNGTPLVFANNGESYNGLVFDGIAARNVSDSYTSLVAYRPVESPPGEGGDTPDDPQPPFGRLKYTSNYIY